MQTESGPKRIEDVQVGEKVWSWRQDSGEVVLAEVVETFVREDQQLMGVTLGNARAHETIKSTVEHPYWTKRGWVAANELTTSDEVLSKAGKWLNVVAVSDITEKSTVYNFEVTGTHSYYVGQHGVLVHNVSRMNLASSASQAARLNRQLASQEIANGHAFVKHVVERGEFPGVRTRAEFASVIEDVMGNASHVRELSGGRVAYWRKGVVVIRNPSAVDGGTAFVPTNGFAYFEGLRYVIYDISATYRTRAAGCRQGVESCRGWTILPGLGV